MSAYLMIAAFIGMAVPGIVRHFWPGYPWLTVIAAVVATVAIVATSEITRARRRRARRKRLHLT